MSSSPLHPLVPGTEFNYSDRLMSVGWNHSHIQLGWHHRPSWDPVLALNTWHPPAKCVIAAHYAGISTVIQTCFALKSSILCKILFENEVRTLPRVESTPYLVAWISASQEQKQSSLVKFHQSGLTQQEPHPRHLSFLVESINSDKWMDEWNIWCALSSPMIPCFHQWVSIIPRIKIYLSQPLRLLPCQLPLLRLPWLLILSTMVSFRKTSLLQDTCLRRYPQHHPSLCMIHFSLPLQRSIREMYSKGHLWCPTMPLNWSDSVSYALRAHFSTKVPHL